MEICAPDWLKHPIYRLLTQIIFGFIYMIYIPDLALCYKKQAYVV